MELKELPVFTQTNLGTCVVVAVSPDITAGKFKGELERAHICCFPELGFLSIDEVMVKQINCYYRLPDMLPLEHVFHGLQDSWFLYVNVSRLKFFPDINNSTKFRQNLAEIQSNKQNLGSKAVPQGEAQVYPPMKKKKKKKKKRKKNPKVKNFSERLGDDILEPEPKGNVSSVCEGKRRGQQEVLHPSEVSDFNATALVSTPPSRKEKMRKRKPKLKKCAERFSHERLEPEQKGNTSSVCQKKLSGQQEVQHPSKVSESNATAESPCGSLSGAVSVSGIIDRYFTNFINVDPNGSASSSEATTGTGQCDMENISLDKNSSKKRNSLKTRQRLLPSLLPEDSNNVVGLKNNYERSEVGNRLVVASSNLGSSQRSSLSKVKKLLDSDAGSIIRNLIFEVN
ncbi:hypothetical protein SOVF_020590 [Spinacia oleracea]|uniref:Uncharacterized protein isoform X1 n=1 Tax=Spinacia oleracea TaxID=3562 RepID=A0A9R0JPY4_SPIOL|nr:uncharacterized protein LOC110782753 isoform X1 [Spinacia oleracea]KNA23832.1 hypothetical protein SOVF_020590 [Spinacia oleracea]